jgi:photoactive yellow protein
MDGESAMEFDQIDLLPTLDAATDEVLDTLTFGVIGIDADGQVQRYNSMESKMAALSPAKVLGNHLFTAVAPCMNNFMVAQRFEDALADGSTLDETIDYVLTLRMRPIKVKLRLLAATAVARRYVLIQRRT